jgi:DNA-binding transcriptional regulator YiaG
MNHPQFTKFSPITVTVKKNIRQLRLNAGYSMNEGARLLGISRKQLEDIETRSKLRLPHGPGTAGKNESHLQNIAG